MEPSEAFILVLVGTLCAYGEFVRPGRVVAGLTGSLMVVAGVHGLSRMQLSGAGIALSGIAAALFLSEAFWRVCFASGAAATALLSASSCLLVRHPHSLSPGLTIPGCVIFGGMTTFLCWQGKRARQNKWQDLNEGAPAVN
jgi:membrane-bound ClpP family serine protease